LILNWRNLVLYSKYWFLLNSRFLLNKVGTWLWSLNKISLIICWFLKFLNFFFFLIGPLGDLSCRKCIFIRTVLIRYWQEGHLLSLIMSRRILASKSKNRSWGFFSWGVNWGKKVNWKFCSHHLIESSIFIVNRVCSSSKSCLRLFYQWDFIIQQWIVNIELWLFWKAFIILISVTWTLFVFLRQLFRVLGLVFLDSLRKTAELLFSWRINVFAIVDEKIEMILFLLRVLRSVSCSWFKRSLRAWFKRGARII